MLVVIWVLNNIIAYRLPTACRGVPSENYPYQTTNDFEKLLDLENVENTTMITAPILLVFRMHIGPTKFLENGTLNAEIDMNGRLRTGSTGLDWDDYAKIEKANAIDKDDVDKEEDPRERNRRLKREKQHQKRAAKAKTRLA